MSIRSVLGKASTALRERRAHVREQNITELRLQASALRKERTELTELTAIQRQVAEEQAMVKQLRKERLHHKYGGFGTSLYHEPIKEHGEATPRGVFGLQGKDLDLNESSVFHGFKKLSDDTE